MIYFLQEQVVSEGCQRAKDLLHLLSDASVKAYFMFLEYVLNEFNRFNAQFQRDGTMVHVLQPRSVELLTFFLSKFLKPALLEHVDLIGHVDLSAPANQLALKDVDLGIDCEVYLDQIIEEGISQEIVDAARLNCLKFYITASREILNRLPVNDIFLRQLAVFKAETALFNSDRDSTCHDVLSVCRRLRDFDEDAIKKEWSSLFFVNAAQRHTWSTLTFDKMWVAISMLRSSEGNICFPNLHSLLCAIRILPHSIAAAERAFSLISEIKSKKRNSMGPQTLNSLCIFRVALNAREETARSMIIDKDHLKLMKSKNLYRKIESSQNLSKLNLHIG